MRCVRETQSEYDRSAVTWSKQVEAAGQGLMHPPTSNHIAQLVVSRVRALLEDARGAGVVAHGTTIGTAREQLLRRFLTTVLPPPFAITSGFISDPVGRLTPQLDAIVYDPARIPPIAVTDDVMVVPSDSALLAVEIKSTFTVATLPQLQAQLNAITGMAHSGESADEAATVIVPQVAVAFDSDVSIATMESWFAACPNLVLLSVLNDLTVAKTGTANTVTHTGPDGTYANVRAFIVHFFAVVHQVARLRQKISPRLAHYLMPEWRVPAG